MKGFENFFHVFEEIRKHPKQRVCIAAAEEETVLKAVREALKEQVANIILIGHEEKIWRLAMTSGLNLQEVEIINVINPLEAVQKAVQLVEDKKADILMKGMVNSKDFLKTILKSGKLRRGKLLSHLAAYEIPGYYRLIFMTDGGLNVKPNLEEKSAILENALDFLHTIGLSRPKVAILSSNEKVDPRIQSTVDAFELKKASQEGMFKDAVIDGPIALDVAISYEASLRKGIDSPLAGLSDLLFVPNIEGGNLLGKAIIFFASGRMAGLVLGASNPIVLTSRNEPSHGKVASIALAAYYMIKKQKG